MYRKSLTLEEIKRQRDTFREFIENLDILEKVTVELLKNESQLFEEYIAQKYIELQHLNDVVSFLNNGGYRVKTGSKPLGERKYITNDVADIIENRKKESKIFSLAFAYFQYNKDVTDIKPLIKLVKSFI